MKENLEKRLLALFLVALVVLIVVVVAAIRNIHRAVTTADWLNHSHAALLEAESILSALHASEAALRSYVLTGDPRDLTACREGFAQMNEHLQVAKALTRQEEAQHQQMAHLEALLVQRLEFVSQVVKARQQPGFEAARRLLAADAGGLPLREVQRQVGKLKEAEMEALRQRDRDSYFQAQATRWTVLAGVGLNLLLLGFAAWLIRDDLAARRRWAAALQATNELLETKVGERTAELTVANEALKTENLERQWANQALEHQLRYSQLILHSMGDLILVISKARNIIRSNPAVELQTGWETQTLIGSPLARLLRILPKVEGVGPAGGDPVMQALKAGRELHEWPGNLLQKDGLATPVSVSLFPLRDRDKVVAGVVVVRLGPRSIRPSRDQEPTI